MRENCDTKIIVDTNLWISFLMGKRLSCLLELISRNDVEIIVCKELLNEIHEVTRRPKVAKYFTADKLALLWDFMLQETDFYEIMEVPSRCRDPKDDYLLELASVSQANYLITGDKDLLSIKKVDTCQIVTAVEFETLTGMLGYFSEVHEEEGDYISIIIDA